MKYYKNTLSIILTLLILVSAISISPANATPEINTKIATESAQPFTTDDKGIITKTVGQCTSVFNAETCELTISGTGKIDRRMVIDPEKIKSVDIQEGITVINAHTFHFCYQLSQVSLPDTLTEIGYCAFSHTELQEIIIPENVEIIRENAFYDCKFTEVVLPNSISTLEHQALGWCTSLKKVVISKGVSGINGNPFPGCSALDTIIVEENNQSYKSVNNVLMTKDSKEIICYPSSKKDKTYKLPDKTKRIHSDAFRGAYFTKVILPKGLKTIGESAFRFCSSLKFITIPDSVTEMGKWAFEGCTSLENIKIGKKLRKIRLSSFEGCTSLKEVTIPKTVSVIGAQVFDRCTNLKKVTLEQGIKTIGSSAFYDCPKLKSVLVPKSVKTINTTAFGYYGNDKRLPGFVLKGYKNTAAEQYAKEDTYASDFSVSVLMFRNIEKKTRITVKTPRITLKIGENKKVKTIIKQAYGRTIYKSADRKVATVTQKGKVAGVSKGTARITIFHNGYRKAVYVTVK